MSTASGSGGTLAVSKAWLRVAIDHRVHVFRGTLELTEKRLRFSLIRDEVAKGGEIDAVGAWLAEQTGDPTAPDRTARGEKVSLFDIERQNADIRFRLRGLGITMLIKHGGQAWVIYFVGVASSGSPAADGLVYLARLSGGRRASKPFRRAFR
jgi:hypothetical protein